MAALVTSLLPSLVGLSLGMRHALEPDHLAAVSTLASEQRGGLGASLRLGLFWGAGHTLSLLLVGGSLALLGAQMPAQLGFAFELLVAIMITALGIRAVVRAVAEGRAGFEHVHAHGELTHTHAAPSEHLHLSRWTVATRPLLIGLMHGLAGSGALTALVIPGLPTASARLSYIALFGAGSIVGMSLLTGLAGVPLMKLARSPRLAAALLLVTGLVSASIGAWWGWSATVQLILSLPLPLGRGSG
jgi:high-affinity nickel-transport protein